MKIRSLKYTHRDHERFHNSNANANLLVFDSKTHRNDLRKKSMNISRVGKRVDIIYEIN